jgi:hypothetical protein
MGRGVLRETGPIFRRVSYQGSCKCPQSMLLFKVLLFFFFSPVQRKQIACFVSVFLFTSTIIAVGE